MKFEITILGSSSAVPTVDRNQSSQLLNIHENFILIDAGEGTQKQFLRYKIKQSKINYILISHLHPDHFIGLIGIICSFNLRGRKEPLTIIGPEGIQEIIDVQLKHSNSILNYALLFIKTGKPTGTILFEHCNFNITEIQLKHRIPCSGFLIKEKLAEYRIDNEKINGTDIPIKAFNFFKQGKDYIDENNKKYNFKDFTTKNYKSRSYAYLSDTLIDLNLAEFIKGVSILYHDATFANDMQDKALKTFHSTTGQAATLAKIAEVEQLIIGHFSTRYLHLEPLLLEAKQIFNNSSLAIEGAVFNIDKK